MEETPQGSLPLGNLQLVVGALMAGVVGLLAVALLLRPPGPGSFALSEAQTIWLGVAMAIVAGAAALGVVLGRLLLARAAVNAGRESRGEGELLRDFAAFSIVRCAIIEGVGLLGVTIYLVVDLGIGLLVTAASLVGLLVLFPTAARQRAFEERVARPE